MIRTKQLPAGNQGILGIWHEIQKAKRRVKRKAKKDGKEIFQLAMQEEATPEALNGLVYQESLIELIFFTLDHRKAVTTYVNRQKSIDARATKTANDHDMVFDWCNKNPVEARKPYHHSVPKAAAAMNIKQKTTVRKFISVWRKDNNKK